MSDALPVPDPLADPQLQALINQLNQAAADLQAYLDTQAPSQKGVSESAGLLPPLAQQALAQADAQAHRLANILQNIRDSVIVTNLQGTVTYWNEGASALFGFTAAEVIGHSLSLVFTDAARMQMILQQGAAGQEFRADLLFVRRDGTKVWVDLRATPLRDAQGQIVGLIGVSNDITEAKQAELALQESETRFAALFHVSPAAISLTSVIGGRFIDVNEAFERLMGYSRVEVINHTAQELALWPIGEMREEVLKFLHQRRTVHELALTFRHKSGRLIETLTSLEIIPLAGEEYIVGISQDLTQIKQAQAAIHQSEERFQLVARASNDAVWDWDMVSDVVWWSDAYFRLFGYTRDQVTTNSDSWIAHIHPDEREQVMRGIEASVRAHEETWTAEYRFERGDGTYADIFDRGYVVRDANDRPVRMLGSMVDISDRKRADAQIRFQAHLLDHVGQAVVAFNSQGSVIYWNSFAERLYGWTKEEILGRNVFDRPGQLEASFGVTEIREKLQQGAPWSGEFVVPRRAGTGFPAYITISPLQDEAGRPIGTVAVSTDISQLKQVQDLLQQNEARFRALIENSTDGIALLDSQGMVQYTNSATTRMLGYEPEELVHLNGLELIHPDDIEALRNLLFQDTPAPGQVAWAEYRFRHKDGTWRWLNGTVQNLIHDPAVRGLIINYRDVTERKQAELETEQRNHELATISNLSSALRVAATRSQMLPILLEQIVSLLQATGSSLVMPDESQNEWVVELGKGSFAVATGNRFANSEGASRIVMETGQPYIIPNALLDSNLKQSVPIKNPLALVGVPLTTQQRIIGILWVGRYTPFRPDEVRLLTAVADIAANAIQRATLHEQTERQLERLQSLRAIDQVIKGSLDLRLTSTVLLDHILAQLRVDAVDILLLKRHSQILEYAAGRGFRTSEIQTTRLPLGHSWAGRAALQRQIVSELNLQASDEHLVKRQLWSAEDFRVYFGVPLIAKGQVLGVLEIFNRSPLRPNDEWLSFLSSLADQTAIAIDNSQLFEDLQRSNLEMSLAYDATIEGWSHALDLRDKETEGHSRRVTAMTVELAQASGSFNGSEINYIRWGALLHDIGKMGIPDQILLKPGPLNDEEWEIMRRHPAYAYDLLAPIAYLRPALDIPYCHHEKWDGSGYPRRLKREQIPLAAQLFAVVDVWDALRSDRPYRPAWPVEKVRAHLQGLTGTHFAPEVVKTFLTLDAEGSQRLDR